jgi:hypothetical protein
MAAGLLLLLLAVGGLEIGLRRSCQPSPELLTSTTCITVQSLLSSSDVVHHELRPTNSQPGSGLECSISPDFRANSMGCRGPEVAPTKTPGTYRILFLGDDTVCNPWISEEATLPEQFRQQMQPQTAARLEVINGAVPGDCPLLAGLRFHHRLATLRPDLVILHFDMSDVADDSRYRRYLTTSGVRSTCPHPALTAPASKAASFLNLVRQSAIADWVIDHSRQYVRQSISDRRAITEDAPFAWIADDVIDQRTRISHTLQPILRLREEVQAYGGTLLVASAPVRWQITDGRAAPTLTDRVGIRGITPYRTRLPFEVIRQFCRLEQIRFVDCVAEFESADDRESLFSSTQAVLSPEGIRIYADVIRQFLQSGPPLHSPQSTAVPRPRN